MMKAKNRKIIKFAGSKDEGARNFLRNVVDTQSYKYKGLKYTLKTKNPEDCDTTLFKDDSALPVFEQSRMENENNPRYAIAKVCVSARDFLKAQAKMLDMNIDEFKKSYNPQQLEHVKQGMKKGHTVPIPVLEFRKSGEVRNFQEGRHRAIAAMEMGKTYMPIFLAKEIK